MSDNELLQAIYQDMQGMKADMQEMKSDMQEMKSNILELKQRVTNLELKLENVTNHNIQLLAENHMNLVDKLNQAIRVSDKTILYEVQVSGLQTRIEKLEQQIEEIKNRIA